jgi:hypothetical protein
MISRSALAHGFLSCWKTERFLAMHLADACMC